MDHGDSSLAISSESRVYKESTYCKREEKAHSSATLQYPRDINLPASNDWEETIPLENAFEAQLSDLQNNLHQEISVQPRVKRTGEIFSEVKTVDLPTYNKKPGTANIKGQLYKIQLSLLFLLQGLIEKGKGKICSFHLAGNMLEAGEFKDVVFESKTKQPFEMDQSSTKKTKITFLHSNHVDDVQKKKVSLHFEGAKPKTKDHNFNINLEKLFSSYRRIKKLLLERENMHLVFGNTVDNTDLDFIFYTNALSTFPENSDIFRKTDVDADNILHLAGKPETQSCYQIIFNKTDEEKTQKYTESTTQLLEQITDTLRNSSDCRQLAKNLAKSIFAETDGRNAQLVHQGILKDYHIPLSETVIAKKTPKSKTGSFKANFLNCDECLSDGDRNFRNIFFEEANKITGKSETELKEELRTKSIKLSEKFGKNSGINENSEILSLPNDHVNAYEIKEFLSKLNIFTEQPGESQLAEIIKEKIKTTFMVEQSELDSIYVDVKTKIESWWKEQNHYLTEKNRFFEDSLRISIFFDVKRPVELFTGRKKQLVNLHSLMHNTSEQTMVVSPIAITGFGGIGKTELVRQYVYKHSADYDNNVIWINADSYASLVASFRRLAEGKLKLSTKNINGKEKEVTTVVEEIYQYFSKRKSLFIFDNAEMYKSREAQDGGIDKFIPTFLQDIKAHILITSRSNEWENIKTIQVLKLDVFTKEEAMRYITRALNLVQASHEKEVEELSIMIQCFPLALQQAVSYIREKNTRLSATEGQFLITDYLDEYRREETGDKFIDYQAWDSNQSLGSSEYGRTTRITVKITLQKMEKMNYGDEALSVLNVMAYFAPDSIFTMIFLKQLPGKRILGSALQLLKDYSVIRLDHGEANIHSLIQRIIRIELKRCNKEEDILREALILVENGIREGEEMSRKCASHAVSVWTYASNYPDLVRNFHGLPREILVTLDHSLRYEEAYLFGIQARVLLEKVLGIYNLDTLNVVIMVAILLVRCGKYNEAEEAFEHVLSKITQVNGDDNYDALHVKHNLASLLDIRGKSAEALEILEDILVKMKHMLGDSHPDTLHVMNTIACVLKSRAKYAEALQVYQQVLDKREELLGCNHCDTLMTKYGMASVYSQTGRYDEAYHLHENILEKTNEVLGSVHPDTLIKKNDFAWVLSNKGKYNDALVTFEDVAEKTQKVLGSDHLHTFMAKGGISHALCQMGHYDEALLIVQKVLDQEQRVLGPSHPEALKVQQHKAVALMEQGKYSEALYTFSQLVKNEISVFGSDHPITLKTQNNMAGVLLNMGKYDESLSLHRYVVRMKERSMGSEHPSTLTTKYNIGTLLQYKGNYSEALKIYEEVLENRSMILEINHPDILMTKASMASVLCEKGSCDEALKIYREVLEASQNVLGREHPKNLISEFSMAGVMYRLHKSDEALAVYENVLEKGKQVLSSDHPQNLITISNMAHVLCDKGYYHLALNISEKVLNTMEELLGSNHPRTLAACHLVAWILYKQGNYSKALKLFRDALYKRNHVLGSDHPAALETLNSIARVLDFQGNYQESSEIYEEVLKKKKQIFGANHPDTLTTMSDIARSLCKQRKYEKALIAYHNVFEKEKDIFGFLHPHTLETRNNMGVVLESQGNYSEAMKIFEEVLSARTKVLGSEHPDTLTTMDVIAHLLDRQGYHDLSLNAYRLELNERRQQFLRPNHPDTLTNENTMDRVLCFDHKLHEKALEMYREVLGKRKKVLGPSNPDTLLTQNNIATVLRAQGKYEDALEIYQEVLEKRKLVLSPDHPDILDSLFHIANLLGDKGCFDLSLELHQDVLARREKILGSQNPHTVQSKNDVAVALCRKGKYEVALHFFREVLSERERMLGPDNVSTLVTQANVASVLYELKRYEESLGIYLKVLDKKEDILGSDHPDTLWTMHNIASISYIVGNYNEALKIDMEVLSRKNQVFGPHHPSTLCSAKRIIDVLETFRLKLGEEKFLELCFNEGNYILHFLAMYGKLDIMQYLIENGANVLSRDEHDTLLHKAVINNNSEVIKLILNYIKDNYGNIDLYIDAPDEEGDTPLMWAAETGNLSSTQVLLEYGANVNTRDKNGWTAMHWAAKQGHKKIVELLLDNGADPNIKDTTDQTALHVAYESLEHGVGDQENLKTVTAVLLSVGH